MGLLRRFLPISRAGLVLWGWRNRAQLADAGRFVVRAVPGLAGGDSEDVVTEARLRARLLRDPRVRRAAGLTVEVREGVARVSGAARPEEVKAAVAIAEHTRGVRRVVDATGARRRPFGRRPGAR